MQPSVPAARNRVRPDCAFPLGNGEPALSLPRPSATRPGSGRFVESVLSKFLPRYADRFPNVRVKLTEALGLDQVPLLERGEVHVGIRHDQGTNPWFESLTVPPLTLKVAPEAPINDPAVPPVLSVPPTPVNEMPLVPPPKIDASS